MCPSLTYFSVMFFLSGSLNCTTGPDGTVIAIDTTRPTSVDQGTEEELRRLLESEPLVGRVSLPDLLARGCPYIALDPIIELTPFPIGTLTQGEADWTLEAWIFVPLFQVSLPLVFNGRSIISDVTYHTLAASELGDTTFTIELPTGRFGMWCETFTEYPGTKTGEPFSSENKSGFLAYGPEGSLTQAMEVHQLQSPCWHFICVSSRVRREDASDPRSRITTLSRLYVNGKLAGRLIRPGFISDIETIGNVRDGRHGFGKFSSLTMLPVSINAEQVAARYKERRIAAETRIRKISLARANTKAPPIPSSDPISVLMPVPDDAA